GRDICERLVDVDTAAAQSTPDVFDVIAHVSGIEHAASGGIVRYDSDVATVRKAVFPAAGLGTRFLPATKAQPKEMLPLVDKPIIQYGVEEAVASGADRIIIVTGRGKNAIEDHFDIAIELESFLEARGKRELVSEVRKISDMINVAYVRQGEPLGLGPRRFRDARPRRRRPVCRHPGRRRDRCEPAGDEAADRPVRTARRAGARGRARAAGSDLELRRRQDRSIRETRRRRVPGAGP